VVDAFAGSCTVPRAALSLGNRFLACERDPAYFNIGKLAILEEILGKPKTEEK